MYRKSRIPVKSIQEIITDNGDNPKTLQSERKGYCIAVVVNGRGLEDVIAITNKIHCSVSGGSVSVVVIANLD